MKDFALFTATITQVNLENRKTTHKVEYSSTNFVSVLDYDKVAYTIDILPSGYRNPISQVPVLNSNSLTFNPPLPGDGAVCAYIEGESILPVCLGVIYNPEGRTNVDKVLKSTGSVYSVDTTKSLDTDLLPTAAKDESVTDINKVVYRRYDYVQQHQTGSYVRIRNLAAASVDDSGNVTQPENNLPEIKIYQKLSDENENTILMQEAEAGSSTIEINHHTGTYIKIDADGNITINGGNVTIDSGNIELGAGATERLILGDSFIPFFNNHFHPTGVGPSGVPTVPMTAIYLSSNNTYTL